MQLMELALHKLEENVKDELLNIISREAFEIAVKIKKCESPIEQIFCMHFIKAASNQGLADSNFLRIIPQWSININGKNRRVDFMIQAQIKGNWYSVIVECDGHEYHERTKAQAAGDRKRDRALKSLGYTVLRFTGSEIYKNPHGCAIEVVEFMKGLAMKEVVTDAKIKVG
jgi:very-short-patch-repair endonuclease